MKRHLRCYRWILAGVVLALVTAVLVIAQPVTAQGTMIDLGGGIATGINNRGQVVGYGGIALGPTEFHAVLWEDGVMTDLGTLGGNLSDAEGINDRGQVVGWSDTESGERHAFLWEKGTMTDLGTMGELHSIAGDINNRGQVVGMSWTVLGEYHAFLWEKGTMTDLGTLGGTSSGASGINDRG